MDPPLDETYYQTQEANPSPEGVRDASLLSCPEGRPCVKTRIPRQFYFWSPRLDFERPTCQAHLSQACSYFFFCSFAAQHSRSIGHISISIPVCLLLFFFCRAAWIGTGGRHLGVESPGRQRMTRSHAPFEQSNGLALVGVKETTDLFFLGCMGLENFVDWRRVVYESFFFLFSALLSGVQPTLRGHEV
jgi:hypothetical protein